MNSGTKDRLGVHGLVTKGLSPKKEKELSITLDGYHRLNYDNNIIIETIIKMEIILIIAIITTISLSS